jgi:hypothetical protein
MSGGELVISLDFELLWGVRDHATRDGYGPNILGARAAIPHMLERFARHGIRVTWATVGAVFCATREELLHHLPPEELRPRYDNGALSNYRYETTTAKVHDSQVWDELLHGEETSVWADKGYVSAEREEAFKGQGKIWGVMRKAPKGAPLHPLDERINRLIAMIRVKVEHPFRVIKRQFGHVKTRYRDLAKNCAQLFTLFALFALANLFLVRRRLMA